MITRYDVMLYFSKLSEGGFFFSPLSFFALAVPAYCSMRMHALLKFV